ncbi:MAG TPA: PIN domain-containing protein [Vicinamibacterales bacterium]|nr:PIN domain-containing protein [Vicinamibacterales bacterium]
MILVDAGPLVALFDPRDDHHDRCVRTLKAVAEPLRTTIPVLTEAFHILQPSSVGADRLRDFIALGGLSVWFFDARALARAFELMEQYADHPMDLADASLVVAAERLGTRRVFTVDRRDFTAYRVRRGHRQHSFDLVV